MDMTSAQTTWAGIALISVALLVGCASRTSIPGGRALAAGPDPGAAHFEALTRAQALIDEHDPIAALPLIDDVLNHYEAEKSTNQRRYSARSMPETLFYLASSAEAMESAVVVGPDWATAFLMKGFALIEARKFVEARSALESGQRVAPRNSAIVSELAFTYQLERDWPTMLELFTVAEEAAHLSPDQVKTQELTRALRGKGFALVELGRLDDAEKTFRECLKLDPKDEGAKSELEYIAQQRRR